MTRSKHYKTNAVVIKSTPLGEADQIVTFLTPNIGKVKAVARGSRRTKSKSRGHLELFNHVSISVAQGKTLDVLTEIDTIRTFRSFRTHLQRMSIAFYVAELSDAFSTEDVDQLGIYTLVIDTLKRLEKTEQFSVLLRHFEMNLLECSGFKPELHHCVECWSTLEIQKQFFDSMSGGCVCPSCKSSNHNKLMSVSINAMKVMRLLQREQSISVIEEIEIPQYVLIEVEQVLRTHLKYLIEKDMKSIKFINLVS